MSNLYSQRLAALQQYIQEELKYDAFLVPHADRYQGEYLAEADERLSWLTGFTGSAGTAIVFPDEVALFVDGRYTLQAKQQVSLEKVKVFHSADLPPLNYLALKLRKGGKVAYDPWLHTIAEQSIWEKKLPNCNFISIDKNPIDVLWLDRPCRPLNPIYFLEDKYTGKSSAEKVKEIANGIEEVGADLAYVSSPDAICWLLNVRGVDFPFSPLVDALCFVGKDKKVYLFIEPIKVSASMKKKLGDNVILLHDSQLGIFLKNLKDNKLLVAPANTPLWIKSHLSSNQLILGEDIIALPKACKNSVEIEGMKQAHVKDGIAITRFLHWFSLNNSPLTELDVVTKLESFRQVEKTYRGESFPTIAGFESNGAIVHYRPESISNKLICGDSLLLLDSGGQYLEGTTDITRTMAIGVPSLEQCEYFTRVLKGHIAIATAQFPKGTSGGQLDILARKFLWDIGEDYDHGTGHGVGCFLGVHEGPQRISKAGFGVSLQPGMIISNEPGYYKTGGYGIRIESLVLVVETDTNSDRNFLKFETITLAPIDTRLVLSEMLSVAEKDWLNTYHQQVRNQLLPYVEADVAAWLIKATEPMS